MRCTGGVSCHCCCCSWQAGCNLDCSDFSGNTPLHMASGLGRSAIASLLLAGGADVQPLNQEGESPLDHAKCRNHESIINLLGDAMEKAPSGDAEGENAGGGCGYVDG